ncbi:putative Fe-S cluster assembly protein SufT [Candidatus Neomarinimicrobiota bacterium]
MTTKEPIKLKRDAKAFLIPSGEKITLLKGETALITQDLGGSYTLIINGNMVKLDGKDADALGFEPEKVIASESSKNLNAPVNEKQVWDQMKSCYDPEIPVNIVDLGLIYDCSIEPLDSGGTLVEVQMTLTAPGCGMGGVIAAEVERKIEALPGVAEVRVNLVWEPQWNRDMMSEAALLQLGIL